MDKKMAYKGKDDMSYNESSIKVASHSQGDAYKVNVEYKTVGEVERIPCPSKASDSYTSK
jgi:hypothetical protein